MPIFKTHSWATKQTALQVKRTKQRGVLPVTLEVNAGKIICRNNKSQLKEKYSHEKMAYAEPKLKSGDYIARRERYSANKRFTLPRQGLLQNQGYSYRFSAKNRA